MKIPTLKLLFLLAIALLFCSCKSVLYGKREITIPNNTTIYAKRMVWGLNGDSSITVISPNEDFSDFRETKSDYVYSWHTTIYYKVENDVLYLYSGQVNPKPPENNEFPVKVEFIKMDQWGLKTNYEKLGLQELIIPVD